MSALVTSIRPSGFVLTPFPSHMTTKRASVIPDFCQTRSRRQLEKRPPPTPAHHLCIPGTEQPLSWAVPISPQGLSRPQRGQEQWHAGLTAHSEGPLYSGAFEGRGSYYFLGGGGLETLWGAKLTRNTCLDILGAPAPGSNTIFYFSSYPQSALPEVLCLSVSSTHSSLAQEPGDDYVFFSTE